MRISKRERLRVYKRALSLFEKEAYDDGICASLVDCTPLPQNIEPTEIQVLFPEFGLFAPDVRRTYWWGCDDDALLNRKIVLDFCIAMAQ